MVDDGERIQVEPDSGIQRADDPLVGTPYRATRLLGKGSTALVYEARPRKGGHRVAVKLLRQHLAASDEAVERMRIEAEALSCMRHANIVRVLDFGRTPDGCPYLVEERLYGRSLYKEILARGPLPAFEATEYVCQLLAALEVVHRLGVIHRDLKLANLFLVRDKRQGTRSLKLVDFGFAKVLRLECSQLRPRPMAVSTGADRFVGTPRYSAPEQAEEGRKLGPSADLYTAGLVLYSLLAGREPFCEIARETDVLMAQIQKELGSPAVHTSKPIATELEQFLRKAVAKDPADRFASASAMKQELEVLSHRFCLAAGLGTSRLMPDVGNPESTELASGLSRAEERTTVRLEPTQLTALATQAAEDEPATTPLPHLGAHVSPAPMAAVQGLPIGPPSAKLSTPGLQVSFIPVEADEKPVNPALSVSSVLVEAEAIEEPVAGATSVPSPGAGVAPSRGWAFPAPISVAFGVLVALTVVLWLVWPGLGVR